MAGEWEDVDAGWEDVPAEVKPSVYDPKAERAKILKKQAEETGSFKAGLIGAGREMDKMATGFMDLIDTGLEILGVPGAAEYREKTKAEQSNLDEIFEPLSDEHPIATTAGAIAPYMATLPLGAASGSARLGTTGAKELGKRILTESAMGGATGATHYDDTALSGAGWGAGGAIGAKYLDDILGGVKPVLKGDAPRIVKYAEDNKLFVPPGMATGKRGFQQMDQAIKTHRTTADKFAEHMDASNVKQNNMVSEELGQKTDYFTEEYIENQKKSVAQTMDDLVAGTTGTVNPDHESIVTNILDEYAASSVSGKPPQILINAENRLMDLVDDGADLTGEAYQNITRRLRQQATQQRGSSSGDKLLAKSLEDIAGVYDDIIDGGVGAANKADWKKARKDWALLSAIDETKDVIGNLDASRLAKKFHSSDTVNNLAEVDRLRKGQPGASLGTSALLGKVANPFKPNEQLGALSLLSSKIVGGAMPFLSDMSTGMYLRGYPHKTGLLGLPKGLVQGTVPSMLMANDAPERE